MPQESNGNPELPEMSNTDVQIPTRNAVWRCVQFFTGLFCRFWIRLEVHGIENLDDTRGGLLVGNHQSHLDPLVVAVRLTRPVSYVARESLFRIPVVGWILRRTYVNGISRDSARAGTIRLSLKRLEEKFLVGIFPEGTRSAGEIGPFRPGVSTIIRKCSSPVYPVGICGSGRALPRGGWFVRPVRVCIVYGKAIDPDEISRLAKSSDRSTLVEHVRAHVVAAFEEAQAKLSK